MSTPVTGWSLRTDRTFFQQAQRRNTRFFTLYFLPYSSFKMAVVVPKTVLKLATDRNKIKRQVKAILSKQLHPPKLKLVLAVRHPAAQATFSELEAELTQIFSRF